MGAFVDAITSGNVTTLYDNDSNTTSKTIDLGDGNHNIRAYGSGVNIKTGDGNSYIEHYGNNGSITTGNGDNKIKSIGREKNITTGNGNQKITSIGSKTNITTGDGDDDVTFIGHDCTLNAGNGNNNIVFWGDNATINAGDGDDTLTTYDQIYQKGEGNQDLNIAFLSTLSSEIYEKWNLTSHEQIDHWQRKSAFRKKQVTVYENHFDVETILKTNINGAQNANINLGNGTNTGTVNLDTNPSLAADATTFGSGTNNINQVESWSIEESLGHRDETKLDTQVKKNMRWGGVALAALNVAITAAACVICPPLGVGIALGTAASMAVGKAQTVGLVAGPIGGIIGGPIVTACAK